MATMKACVQWARKDGFYPVFIRVNHHRQTLYIKTDKMVTMRELSRSKEITDPVVMKFCTTLILDYMEKLNRMDIRDWTCRMIVDFLQKGDEDLCFSDYARQHIDRLIDNGQSRNARNYQLALQHMERFFGTTSVKFSQMTSTNMTKWIKSLEQTNRAKEMYPVCMRQVFRAATEELNDYDTGLIRVKTNPWVKVKIPKADRPEKRAISAEDCRRFFAAPLPESKMKSPLPELGRDVAMMVLCLAGINTVDLYGLKKEDYHGGIIHYRRAKTMRSRADGAYMEMRVPDIIKPLFEKYASAPDSKWLFNFQDRHSTSDSFSANVNIGIKKICESMGLDKSAWYCVYTFRHTWGTVAQNDCGATLSEVGFGMNHSQNKVTRGYIKLDFTPAWELNERVVDFIFFSDQASKQGAQEEESSVFRLSPKMLIKAAAFFQGKCLASFDDIGGSNIDEVIARLVRELPSDIPPRSMVQFKIVNCDNGKSAVYERQKGKGF